jgi:hypothetical protein
MASPNAARFIRARAGAIDRVEMRAFTGLDQNRLRLMRRDAIAAIGD